MFVKFDMLDGGKLTNAFKADLRHEATEELFKVH